MERVIRPGKVWLDTDGKRIQAHGAYMHYENGTFYWYVENKEKTVPGSGIWHWGVRCYTSQDLCNWKDEGLIIEPDTEHKDSILYPAAYLDRPHILFNEKTKKYVCWLKFSGMDVRNHYFCIMTADNILGPYEMAVPKFFPDGDVVGDYDLCKDEETGKAYLFAEVDVSHIISYTLTEDYLGVKGEKYIHYEDGYREGPAHFSRNGHHYLLTSGRTGYIPNPSLIAISDNWHGPYEIQGDPHVNDEDQASFNSQVSCIFKHPTKKDLYIAMADRWVPDFKVTKGVSEKIWNIIVAMYMQQEISPEDMEWFNALPMLDTANTSVADYVWLPLRFDGDKVIIEWRDEWSPEEYE